MSTRLGLAIAAVLLLAPPDAAAHPCCWREEVTLQIESVTVDGIEQEDLSAYTTERAPALVGQSLSVTLYFGSADPYCGSYESCDLLFEERYGHGGGLR